MFNILDTHWPDMMTKNQSEGLCSTIVKQRAENREQNQLERQAISSESGPTAARWIHLRVLISLGTDSSTDQSPKRSICN